MVRLKDIAAVAGVSVMTVSKVMHDAKDISAATKSRVRALADKMGYLPDTAAQGLRSRTSKMFGLVIPAMTNPVFARVVMAIEQQAYELGYDILLAHSLNSPEREEKCIRRLLSRRIDGLFVVPVYRQAQTAPIYEELLQRAVPTVILGQRAPFCGKFVSVETDDVAASMTLTRHLVDLGHRRIAFFCGPQFNPWAAERFEGYRRALREGHLQIRVHQKVMRNVIGHQSGGQLADHRPHFRQLAEVFIREIASQGLFVGVQRLAKPQQPFEQGQQLDVVRV